MSIKLSSGRELNEVLGLALCLEDNGDYLTMGYDSVASIDASQDEISSDPDYYLPIQLTPEERFEIAGLMISRWEKWAKRPG